MGSSISQIFGRMDAFTKGEVQALACKSSHLSGLVLVGLCLRHKLPFSELSAVFPNFDLTWIEDQLSQVMADPTVSRWYFENIDRFDADFVGILGLQPGKFPPLRSGNPVSAGVQSGDAKLAIPSMPVAPRPLIGWFRKKGQGDGPARLETMPASAHP